MSSSRLCLFKVDYLAGIYMLSQLISSCIVPLLAYQMLASCVVNSGDEISCNHYQFVFPNKPDASL